MYDLNHSPGAWRDGSCPVGKPQHGEDPGEESVPVCTSQISHPWPSGCPSLSFSLGPHEGPAAFPTTQCLPPVFHVLQGQWEGGKRGKVFFFCLPHRIQMCHSTPVTSLGVSQNCPVLSPALNRKAPEVMLQPQALFSQIPRTV